MLAKIAKCLAAIIIPPLAQAVRDEIGKQIPTIIHAVITAVAESAGQLTVDSLHKVTDVIPGHLDDDIVNNIVTNVLGKLGL